MNCKFCLDEIDKPIHCETCGDDGFCADCAEDCAHLDAEDAAEMAVTWPEQSA